MASEQERADMIEQLRERLVKLLHTNEGFRVAMQCVWHGTAKDRKVIVKSFKTFVKKIAMEEHGHYVLLTMFDCIDDTVLVKKVIMSELADNLSELAAHRHDRRVLLYLLCPRNPIYFNSVVLRVLASGDARNHLKHIVVSFTVQSHHY
ncbi:pumilio homolog 3-like isoform X5 [Dysidea avara]